MSAWDFVIHPERCTGCMLCVLACSLHHAKRFDRKIASIEVSVSGKERKTIVSIHTVNDGERRACDYCEGEKEPLCIKYCPTNVIVRR